MIGIGINDVTIAKTFIDKKNLVITFEEALKADKPKLSLFEKSLQARTADEGTGQYNLNIFSPLLSKKEEFTAEKKLNMIHADLNALIKQMSQILEQFTLTSEIDLDAFEVQFANTGITDQATLEQRMVQQEVVDKIYDNVVKRFVELMQPHIPSDASQRPKLRLKLVRNYKNFPELPKRDIRDNPFIELASIPAEQARVKFTEYEIAQGMNVSKPVTQDAAEKKTAGTAAVTAKKNVVDDNPFAPR